MTKNEIIQRLAEDGVVEKIVRKIAHSSLSGNLKDLAQSVYLVLMEQKDELIERLWEDKQIKFYIARITMNQYWSDTSEFAVRYRQYYKRNVSLEEAKGHTAEAYLPRY